MIKKFLKIILLKLNFISSKTISRMQKHLVRVVSDEEITNYVKSFNQSNIEVLEISGNRWEMLFGADNYRSLSFPEIDVAKSLNQNTTTIDNNTAIQGIRNTVRSIVICSSDSNSVGILVFIAFTVVFLFVRNYTCTERTIR